MDKKTATAKLNLAIFITVFFLLFAATEAYGLVAGQKLWVRRFGDNVSESRLEWVGSNVKTFVGSDAKGNAYVTGVSASDYVTVKYNSTGVRKWTNHYNGPGDSLDQPRAMTVDSTGNVYLAGESFAGEEAGNCFIILKYSASGQRLWVRRYISPPEKGGYFDRPIDLAVDKKGNTYVLGVVEGLDFDPSLVIVKYGPLGKKKWERFFTGANNAQADPAKIVLDGRGNLYVTATIFGLNYDSSDFSLIKYDINGNRQWVKRYRRDGYESASSLGVDGLGNIVITGSFGYSPTGLKEGIGIIKYQYDGVRKWTRVYSADNNSGIGMAVAFDTSNTIYIGGQSTLSGVTSWGDPNSDITLAKLGSDGNLIWAKNMAGYGTNKDAFGGMAIAKDNTILLAGTSWTGVANAYGFSTYKFDQTGKILWSRRFSSLPDGGQDMVHDIAFDAQGNALIAGTGLDAGNKFDAVLVKYAK